MRHEYYGISPEDLGKGAKLPVLKLGDSGEVFYELAAEMLEEIRRHNEKGERTVFICPVGPVGQYPVFVRLVNRERVSLKNCWFFNMDEYLNDNGEPVDRSDPLSFRGFMDRAVYSQIAEDLIMPENQRVFPNPEDPSSGDRLLSELGGPDMCVGGIGITGHIAFNEPQPELSPEEFAALPTRVLTIRPETRTTNCIGDLGGALEDMPHKCVTIGMKQILSARKIRLAVFRDWHRAVCRRAAYGEVTASFPATLIQNHPDALLIVNHTAAEKPF
jgi:glucosamine-6-phosphate deaminase